MASPSKNVNVNVSAQHEDDMKFCFDEDDNAGLVDDEEASLLGETSALLTSHRRNFDH
eukprot:CAMPEP_0113855998 /NCGR_PEP_ID=MMETSP0372-20130328/8796_1 /TAXON_ID=340204 /ORGANISM="Lankesteria abbotti" /LENGTH=57 /DNA_ID=CAMNT_0000830559 /DNA_START=47 /DNA_END=217 /DNA_ORIENTATION=+ /assembly_acc=CAM_ASM_000359